MRTAVSIYILIPLILVPQLLLGGAMIKFDDLHRSITDKIYVPVVGDIMATRWAHEALCVEQFKRNRFERPLFRYDMEVSQNEWYSSFLVPALKVIADENLSAAANPGRKEYFDDNFTKLRYHLTDLSELEGLNPGSWINRLNAGQYGKEEAELVKAHLDSLRSIIRLKSRTFTAMRDTLYNQIEQELTKDGLVRLREANYNENLANIVLNRLNASKIFDAGERLVQKADPIFMRPDSRYGRAHFFAPYKMVGSIRVDTLLFNIIAIWIMIVILFITLYYNILKKFVLLLETMKIPLLKKFGREFLPF